MAYLRDEDQVCTSTQARLLKKLGEDGVLYRPAKYWYTGDTILNKDVLSAVFPKTDFEDYLVLPAFNGSELGELIVGRGHGHALPTWNGAAWTVDLNYVIKIDGWINTYQHEAHARAAMLINILYCEAFKNL